MILLCFVCASPAGYAQDGDNQNSVGLEEIVVTAQKKEQGLQDVPISVLAFSTDRLDNLGVNDIRDLSLFTPNVETSGSANQIRINIRGIGSDDFGVGGDPSVGVYVDGIYIARGGGAETAFNDIQRIEVLNGPQGTLFGRNAAAGAIQYITNKPHDGTEGWVKTTIGNHERFQLEGIFNTPISDTVFWRGGFLYNQRDGFIRNETTGNDVGERENIAFTSTLRWQPDESFDALWRLEYDENDNIGRPASSATIGLRDNGAQFNRVQNDDELPSDREIFGTSLHITKDLGFAELTSITSYREYETLNPEEQDGSADPTFRFNDLNSEDNEQWSQELRLAGSLNDRINWLVGATYSEEEAKQRSGITLSTLAVDRILTETQIGAPFGFLPIGTGFDAIFNFGFPGVPRSFNTGAEAIAAGEYFEFIDVEGDYQSFGIFADVTWALTDTLDLTTGIRYSDDEKRFGRNVAFNEFGIALAFAETRVNAQGQLDPNGEQGTFFQEDSWDDTTGRVVLDWQVTEEALLYASWSSGYKSGGFNSVGQTNDEPSFEPETVESIEFGIKSTWLDNRLRVNAAYFDYDFNDLQELASVPAECLGTSFDNFQFLNSDIEGDGFELSINWLALPGLELWANLGDVQAEVTERTRCVVIDGQPVDQDQSGDTFADRFSYSLGANYNFNLNNGSEVYASVSWAKDDDQDNRTSCSFVQDLPNGNGAVSELREINGQLQITAPTVTGALTSLPFNQCPSLDGRESLNARITYTTANENWQFGAWITNATDWAGDSDPGGFATSFRSPFSDGSPSFSNRVDPRLYGIDIRYSF